MWALMHAIGLCATCTSNHRLEDLGFELFPHALMFSWVSSRFFSYNHCDCLRTVGSIVEVKGGKSGVVVSVSIGLVICRGTSADLGPSLDSFFMLGHK